MSPAPQVEGMEFPEHEHREYPKVLYAGGVERDSEGTVSESRTVNSPEEEAEAQAEGFGTVGAAPAAGEPEEAEAVEAGPVPGSEEAMAQSQEAAPLSEPAPAAPARRKKTTAEK